MRDGYTLPVSRTDGRRKLPWVLHPIHRAKFEARMKTRKRNTETMALNTLARHGLTLEEAKAMPDDLLLTMPGFGKRCLAWVRSTTA